MWLTRQVDEHPSLLVGLRHTGVGSLQLSCHLFYLPKQQVAQTLKHDCLYRQVLKTQVFFVVHKKKIFSCLWIFYLCLGTACCCFMQFFVWFFKVFFFFTWSPLLDLGFDKQDWTGFCSANVRFHLVWSKGLRERGRERNFIRGFTVNTFKKKKNTSKKRELIGLISYCLVREH